MKAKEYLLFIILIFLILVNVSCISAAENNTAPLETNLVVDEINENELSLCENNECALSQNDIDQTDEGLLTQNQNDVKLSDFQPEKTQITLTINDTSELESTGNITINVHFSFTAIQHNGEFTSQNLSIYENNTLIKKLNIGEQNLPELGLIPTTPGTHPSIAYQADLLLNYTVKDNTYLTASLCGVYSNTLQFEKIKNVEIYTLNNTNILINNQPLSTNTPLSNNITSLKKALELIKNNETLNLNNLNIIQDIGEVIVLNKNITITGNNATFTLQNKGLLFEINSNTSITFVNLTFIGNNPYIINNNGNVKLLNCTFKENNKGLIANNGELEIIESQFIELNQISLDRLTSNLDGLIENNGILKITNTTFTNKELLPYSLPIETETLKAIIYNNGILTIDNIQIKNLKDRIIYNNGKLILTNTLIENINPIGTTAIFKTSIQQTLNNQYTYNTYIINSKTKSIDGAAIYNNNQTDIINSTFKCVSGNKGGMIYNIGVLNVNNAQFNKSSGIAIYNTGLLNVNNSIISECNGVGAAIYNTNIANIENCQINDNQASTDVKWRYETQSNGQVFSFIDKVYAGVIYNGENANANITKSIIKNNILYIGGGVLTYYGNIKNDGNLQIYGCIFDNNRPYWDDRLNQGDGSFNIYNTGRITVMYSYLLNTKIYVGTPTGSGTFSPQSFLYNTGNGNCNINYNFFCLDSNSIIRNANPNYYFTVTWDKDYYPIKFNESRNIILFLNLTDGYNIIDFKDWDKLPNGGLKTTITLNKTNLFNVTINNNVTFPFANADLKGEYVLCANIGGQKIYTLLDLGKEYANMTVDYNNITYNDGNNVTFYMNVTGNNIPLTGNITLTFESQKYIFPLINGSCKFTAPSDLKPNNYTVKIEYGGNDDYFKIKNQYYSFSVNKIPTNYTVIVPEIKIGDVGKLTVTVTPSTAKLVGYLYVDGKLKRKFTIPSTITLDLKNYAVGTYNLTVKFEEDEYYLGGEVSTLFIVSKYQTNMTVVSEDIKAGENETLNITISPDDVRGEAFIQINNESTSIFINDTVTSITLTDLSEGTYYVTVYYPGDAKYAASNASTVFSVSRITSRLTVNITQNTNLTGSIRIWANPVNCTGEVLIFINNDQIRMNLTNGSIDTPVKFKRGSNYIYIQYNGDEYYSVSTWNTTFSIDGIPVLTMETQELLSNETGYVRINLTDTNNIPYEYTDITVEFNNQTVTLMTDENGTVYFPVNADAGSYPIKATYNTTSILKTVIVKMPVKLTVKIADINAADDLIVTATLTDMNNEKLTANITLEINGQYYKVVVKDGSGSRNLGEFKAKTYSYTATYVGSGILSSAVSSGSFKVAANKYKITGNKNINQFYGANKVYKIRLLNNNKAVANAAVKVTVNKQVKTLKTNKYGYVSVKISLKPGTYTISAAYKSVKVSNKITVKTTLVTANKNLKGKNLVYSAKVLNKNGKSFKNKVVTFKFSGKTYKVKTDAKGFAKLTVKNVKTGKYKIITTYSNLKNTNTINLKN